LKILLDTHILLWWMGNDPLLSQKARSLIAEPTHAIFVSAVTVWEIYLKQSIGKLRIPDTFSKALLNESFETLPLTARQASVVAELEWHHRDPFDRMLIAQAKIERLTFLTADAPLKAYGAFVELV
jgi:PIN domain nuclease of toxin-antitoxin system